MRWGRAAVWMLVVVLVTAGLAACGGGETPSGSGPTATQTVRSGDIDPVSGLPWVLEEELPIEARHTLALIDQGGPFPFPGKDGSTFGNFEGLLPDHPDGSYPEYTVVTPGSPDRGARRIVTGGAGEFYWTEDHYNSFERISRRPT